MYTLSYICNLCLQPRFLAYHDYIVYISQACNSIVQFFTDINLWKFSCFCIYLLILINTILFIVSTLVSLQCFLYHESQIFNIPISSAHALRGQFILSGNTPILGICLSHRSHLILLVYMCKLNLIIRPSFWYFPLHFIFIHNFLGCFSLPTLCSYYSSSISLFESLIKIPPVKMDLQHCRTHAIDIPAAMPFFFFILFNV